MTSYELRIDGGGRNLTRALTVSYVGHSQAAGFTYTYTMTGLTPNTPYRLYLTASNAPLSGAAPEYYTGSSAESTAAYDTTAEAAPAAVTLASTNVDELTNVSMLVTLATANSYGLPLERYFLRICAYTSSGGCSAAYDHTIDVAAAATPPTTIYIGPPSNAEPSATGHLLEALNAASDYQIQAAASNSYGNGTFGAWLQVTCRAHPRGVRSPAPRLPCPVHSMRACRSILSTGRNGEDPWHGRPLR